LAQVNISFGYSRLWRHLLGAVFLAPPMSLPVPASSALFAPGYWECLVDTGWTSYSWQSAAVVEAGWRSGVDEVHVEERGFRYAVRFPRTSTADPHEATQVNINTQRSRRMRRWPNLDAKAALATSANKADRDAWQPWIACSWSWPLHCAGTGTAGSKCSCSGIIKRPVSEMPPHSLYNVFPEEDVPAALGYPFNQWPRSATLCAHTDAPRCLANFASQRIAAADASSASGDIEEWDWLISQWQRGGLDDSSELLGAIRIMNRDLLSGFAAVKRTMLQKLLDRDRFTDGQDRSAFLSVQWLWHGTSCIDKVFDICRDGFDRFHAKVCVYGKGCYFAVKAKTSDNYGCSCTADDSSAGSFRAIVLAGVLCGEAVEGSQNMYPPPLKPHSRTGERYENTVDSLSRPNIVVTYKDHQAVPAYVVIYRRRR